MSRSAMRKRQDEERAEKLAEIEQQVQAGTLVIRRMTPKELAHARKVAASRRGTDGRRC